MSDYGNLSREAEVAAISIISSYVGDKGFVRDTGKIEAYDFEISYDDNRSAVGEVSILEDPAYRSGWKALLKQEIHHLSPLPVGFGMWKATLRRTSNINLFLREITSYIEKLKKEGINDLENEDDWPKTSLSDLGRKIGIEHIQKVEGIEGDQIYYNFRGTGGSIPDSTEPLINEVEKLLHDGPFQDSWKKLIPFPADEKHVFLQCGSLISLHLQECFRYPDRRITMSDFRFPEGITHFWLTSSLLDSVTLLWISDGQKMILP